MKIICIARNYAKHAKELDSNVPNIPVFLNKPFYLPGFSNNVHHEVEIVVKINRLGKKIAERFAHRYYDEIGIGIDFTARDIQQECIKNGLPWELAKGFDGSAVLGSFLSKNSFMDLNNLDFSLTINETLVQNCNTSNMVFNIDFLISYISQFVTLKIGDLIYTGTPDGVGPVNVGDQLKAYIGNNELLNFKVK